MHHVEVHRRELGQIGRGADRQRLGDGRVRALPIGERALGFARDELVARPLDQRPGLAMHAGDDVGADRCRLLEAREENVVGDGLHDAGDAGHVKLERTDAVLARIVRHFGDLLLGEYLQVEDRVDVARLVHGPAERR